LPSDLSVWVYIGSCERSESRQGAAGLSLIARRGTGFPGGKDETGPLSDYARLDDRARVQSSNRQLLKFCGSLGGLKV
jgi:hypothetical protein